MQRRVAAYLSFAVLFAPLPCAAAAGKLSAQAWDQRSKGDASAGCGGGEAPQPAVPFSIGAPVPLAQGLSGVRLATPAARQPCWHCLPGGSPPDRKPLPAKLLTSLIAGGVFAGI